MVNEIKSNTQYMISLTTKMDTFINADGPYPIVRLRSLAAAGFLERPFLTADIPYDLVEAYWQEVVALNAVADSMGLQGGTKAFVAQRYPAFLELAGKVISKLTELNKVVGQVLSTLGPLAPI